MVWKKVNNADAGLSTKFGGNDIDKISDAFNGVNVSDPIIYNIDHNTLKHSTTNAAGDMLMGDGTKFSRRARGTALQQIRVNAAGTDVEYFTPTELGGALYTAVISGTTTKLRNNISGAVDYTADNAVDSVTAFNSAFNNIENFANTDGWRAGWIDVTPGVYKCTTMIDLTYLTNARVGLGLKGNGPGTIFNFVPGSALTDAIKITLNYARLRDFSIDLNANVTNAIRIQGANPNGDATYGRLHNVTIVGPNINTTGLPVTNQVGILFDGAAPAPFHWIVDGLDLYIMDIGIKHTPIYGTSAHVSNFMFWGCNVGADVDGSQNFYTNGYIQGQAATTHTGIRLRDDSDHTIIDNVIMEVLNTTPTGAAQGILIDSGAQYCDIDHVSNSYENGTTIKTVVNNSANVTNKIGFRDNFVSTIEAQKYKVNTDITMASGANVILNATTGTKIGTGTTQKLGFYNATPVVQPAANADTSGATLANLEIEVNQLKALLRSIGLMAP